MEEVAKKRKAFVVVGPESSGTRFVTKLFIRVGLVEPLNNIECSNSDFLKEVISRSRGKDSIVCRRSFPHGRRKDMWDICLSDIRDTLIVYGFDPRFIITIREQYALAGSKLYRKHCSIPDRPYESIRKEYVFILRQLTEDINFYLLSTSLLMVSPNRVLRSLSKWVGFDLNTPKNTSFIVDADRKRFKS